MGLDLILKVSSKDEGTQAYLYTQQRRNLSNVGLETNYKQLQNQLQRHWHLSILSVLLVLIKLVVNQLHLVASWLYSIP